MEDLAILVWGVVAYTLGQYLGTNWYSPILFGLGIVVGLGIKRIYAR